MKKIDQLLQAISYTNEVISNNLDFEYIKINNDTKEMELVFSSNTPLKIDDIKEFVTIIDKKESPIFAKTPRVTYHFSINSFSDEDVLDYFELIIDLLSNKNPRMTQILSYSKRYDSIKKEITVEVPYDDNIVSFSRNEIINMYQMFGFKGISINIEKGLDPVPTKDLIKKIRKEIEVDALKQIQNKDQYVTLYENRVFIGDEAKIDDIPTTEGELIELKGVREKINYIIEGKVVFIDSERMQRKDRPSISFIVYDGTNSIMCVRTIFTTNYKEEVAFFSELSLNQKVILQGYPEYNEFYKEVQLKVVNIRRTKISYDITNRRDNAEIPRVELHLHTKMSAQDAIPTMTDYYNAAKLFNHKAIAVTDHFSVQSYHELYELTKDKSIKPLYGLELNFVDEDEIKIIKDEIDAPLLDSNYVVFDFETTGFSVNYQDIIEIGAWKIESGHITEEFHELVNPGREIPETVIKLTGITNSDVSKARSAKEVLTSFYEFIKGTILVAHNADFDMGHLYENLHKLNITDERFPIIDTLTLAKVLFPDRGRFDLGSLSKFLKVSLDNHHRGSDDARATAEIFLHMLQDLRKNGITKVNQLNLLIDKKESFKYPYPKHINLLVKTQAGLKNLYRILSEASTTYFYKEPRITKAFINKYREGILVGSGCRNSYFFEMALNKNEEELRKIIQFYDYIELQPLSTFDYYKNQMDEYKYVIEDTFKKIVRLAKEYSIPVVATGDCHQINKEDTLYRKVLIHTPAVGGGPHYLSHEKDIPDEYFMTTKEMLEQFDFLGEDLAYELVVTNTNLIADSCDFVESFNKKLLAPTDDFLAFKGVPSIEKKVVQMVNDRAHELYGDELPGIVFDRIKKELDSIVTHKFSTIYYISHLLVKKSLDDDYLVGSRGSVGSSLAATFMDITEVNPLPPHYLCPRCHYSAFKMTQEEKEKYGVRSNEKYFQEVLKNAESGYDLPIAKCPVCGSILKRDGHDIPFETFLGFKGDKMPDIDLNFSGEYQGVVHNYIREIFGHNHAFRAGTTSTCASKTAFGMVSRYFDDLNAERLKEELEPIRIKKAEKERIASYVEGSKRTSGQHPGGIVVVPRDYEIYDVTPVQYPGDSEDKSWRTTHLEYHSFQDNLFKLDVLGHDDPTVIKYLMGFVKKYPDEFPFKNAKDIPVNDAKVYELLSDVSCIGVTKEDIYSSVASYGIPEFGTDFVRRMLTDSKPKTFGELVKISGLSHGTDVWNGNAQDLVLGRAKGLPKIPFKDIVSCRDDIMIDLISYGLEPSNAFKIMEFVRKGNVAKDPNTWEEYVKIMHDNNVPDWFIWTCSKIKYMFPKAHATAYVIMAMRIAWFKLYRPIYFYSAFFSKRATAFDALVMTKGEGAIRAKMEDIMAKGKDKSDKEDALMITLELALEMYKRGMHFEPINIQKSMATEFVVTEDKKGLILPFVVVDSLGESVGSSIVEARNEKPFSSRDDVKQRTRLSKTLFDKLEELGVFEELPEDSQLTFDLFNI